MALEQALETQRLRLLRLLAGLSFVVGVLSVAPLASGWSLRTRAFIASVLNRAEAAVERLIFVQACLIAKQRGDEGRWIDRANSVSMDAFPLSCEDMPPSLANLTSRFFALHYRLKNLPRLGERLFQRLKNLVARINDAFADAFFDGFAMMTCDIDRLVSLSQYIMAVPWPPPRGFHPRFFTPV